MSNSFFPAKLTTLTLLSSISEWEASLGIVFQAIFLFRAYTLFSVFDVEPSPSNPLDWICSLGGLHIGVTSVTTMKWYSTFLNRRTLFKGEIEPYIKMKRKKSGQEKESLVWTSKKKMQRWSWFRAHNLLCLLLYPFLLCFCILLWLYLILHLYCSVYQSHWEKRDLFVTFSWECKSIFILLFQSFCHYINFWISF